MIYDFKKVSEFIDSNINLFKQLLKDSISIKSVSNSIENRNDVIEMMKWFDKKLREEGIQSDLYDIGSHSMDDVKLPLPPVILASSIQDPKYKTLLIYGHLDVQPANISDGWDTEPFELIDKGDKMYGRGVADDKGPVIAWLCALKTLNKLNIKIPLNLKFCFEGMEEYGSNGLDDLVISQKDKFFKDIDYVCIADTLWFDTVKPCLTYTIRGVCYFGIEVICGNQDLHSGLFGGAVQEAMTDLIQIMASLVDNKGNILIDGIYDDVVSIKEDEKELLKKLDYDLDKFKDENKVNLTTNDKLQFFEKLWKLPSLSLHGIEGAYSEKGAKTVIPYKVTGKFSIRTVANMNPDVVKTLVEKHCEKIMKDKTDNKITVKQLTSGFPWLNMPQGDNYKAAIIATKNAYGIEPDFIGTGGSIPVTHTFADKICKNCIHLSFSAGDSSIHSQNECLRVSNYINGIKLLADYLYNLSQC